RRRCDHPSTSRNKDKRGRERWWHRRDRRPAPCAPIAGTDERSWLTELDATNATTLRVEPAGNKGVTINLWGACGILNSRGAARLRSAKRLGSAGHPDARSGTEPARLDRRTRTPSRRQAKSWRSLAPRRAASQRGPSVWRTLRPAAPDRRCARPTGR